MIRNRGHKVIQQLRDEYGVRANLAADGKLLLNAIDSRGVSTEAAILAQAFKTQILKELRRKANQCKNNA